ncbi:hypothetical protein FE257_005584 [Aspergillus nanangensis]|uniref:Uncharacterized protein n=1 Tax=Aspergillus nanangensis TaxID=2582783 RepID=A0AAD4CRZ8_ASPNN|nr:hypothetical protein FE257_005584 [Aspergillus nanangensis]
MRITAGRSRHVKPVNLHTTTCPTEHGIWRNTYRKLEVGADATDAKADSPVNDCPKEPGKPLLFVLPGLPEGLSREPNSGNVPEYCDDAEDAATPASVVVD